MSTFTSAMIHCEEKPNVTVPQEFRSVLIEFTVKYMLQRPPNIANFGVDFFTKMLDSQTTKLDRDQKAIDDVRQLCGDYESSGDMPLAMEAVEQDIDVSLALSLPSIADTLMAQFDNALDATSTPSGGENISPPVSLMEMVERVDSASLSVEMDEEVVESTEQ